MKKITAVLFSPFLMAIIMFVFLIAIAVATFIENDFGSASARNLVYNARWFEILLFVGMVNLTGRIFSQKLYKKEKLAVFVFHAAFIVILTGAGVTRYTGIEGSLSVREGATTDAFTTDKAYISLKADGIDQHFKTSFSVLGHNRFKKTVTIHGKPVTLKVKSFAANAIETLVPSSIGSPMAEVIFSDSTGRQRMIISRGETKQLGNLSFSFEAPIVDSLHTVLLFLKGDSLYFMTPFEVGVSGMEDQSFGIIQSHTEYPFHVKKLYTFNDQMVVLNQFLLKGSPIARSIPVEQGRTYDALTVELSSGGTSKELILTGKNSYSGVTKEIYINNDKFTLAYGSIVKPLPFQLKLNDFLISRYPGSQSPASFESRVTVIDKPANKSWQQRIYMNNILKYKGYRIYQSSYDADEKGTILSVNHDLAGTTISYAGYFLMAVGMIMALFNKKSRLALLRNENVYLKNRKKALTVVVMVFLSGVIASGQNNAGKETVIPVNAKHAAEFGKLIIQDNNGRMEPVNTLSSEVLRKLSRKSSYKGQTPDQVFLGMFSDPGKWQYEPIIRATHPGIQKLLGSHEKLFPFTAFFKGNNYILEHEVESAYRKKPALRTKYDNEIIKLDERVNIAYLVFSGEFLKLFPLKGDSAHTWYNHLSIRKKMTTGDSIFTNNVIYAYVQSVRESTESGDWSVPDKIVESIAKYQLENSSGITPPARKIKVEILLNKADIFFTLAKYYGIIGFVLLLLQFTGILYNRLNLRIPVIVFTVLIVLLFCMHSIGLGLRWYVSGHAPWSNGYEALIYIAWASIAAGLLLASRNSITLSVTCVLAFMTLNVAHLSFMDPQITNLVPVLKSYWLVLHVATISASYAFLVMGALIAFLNLLLMIVNNKNQEYITLTINELTNTIEMAFVIGLYLLTIGVFLGAIWANESWGRYWGWDPKETWALVTVLVYSFVTHMRMVPGMKSIYSFNLAALLASGSVIMTYFGVNYYLSGLHSYASGDPVPIPAFVYYVVVVVSITAIAAYIRIRKSNLR